MRHDLQDLQDADWQHTVVHVSRRGRILVMDSMGYVDQRCDVSDVLVCGSHTAVCAAMLSARARPRGIIGHDGGMGKDQGGIRGLQFWDKLRIPGVTTAGASARIGDGADIWERGRISASNRYATLMGVKTGMSVQEAARIMLDSPTPMPKTRHVQHVFADTPEGKVIGLDTVIYADARLKNSVMIMAGHTGIAFARYVFALPFPLRGVINGDAGDAVDASGISGIEEFDRNNVPIAVYSAESARIGDCRDVWANGIISGVGKVAADLGIMRGMTVPEAAVAIMRLSPKHSRK